VEKMNIYMDTTISNMNPAGFVCPKCFSIVQCDVSCPARCPSCSTEVSFVQTEIKIIDEPLEQYMFGKLSKLNMDIKTNVLDELNVRYDMFLIPGEYPAYYFAFPMWVCYFPIGGEKFRLLYLIVFDLSDYKDLHGRKCFFMMNFFDSKTSIARSLFYNMPTQAIPGEQTKKDVYVFICPPTFFRYLVSNNLIKQKPQHLNVGVFMYANASPYLRKYQSKNLFHTLIEGAAGYLGDSVIPEAAVVWKFIRERLMYDIYNPEEYLQEYAATLPIPTIPIMGGTYEYLYNLFLKSNEAWNTYTMTFHVAEFQALQFKKIHTPTIRMAIPYLTKLGVIKYLGRIYYQPTHIEKPLIPIYKLPPIMSLILKFLQSVQQAHINDLLSFLFEQGYNIEKLSLESLLKYLNESVFVRHAKRGKYIKILNGAYSLSNTFRDIEIFDDKGIKNEWLVRRVFSYVCWANKYGLGLSMKAFRVDEDLSKLGIQEASDIVDRLLGKPFDFISYDKARRIYYLGDFGKNFGCDEKSPYFDKVLEKQKELDGIRRTRGLETYLDYIGDDDFE